MNTEKSENSRIEELLNIFYFFLVEGFVVFSVGKEIPISFRWASYTLAVVVTLTASVVLIRAHKTRCGAGDRRQRIPGTVVLFSLITGLLTASINRPDIDDSVYAPKAVFYTEHPDSLLDRSITWIAGIPEDAYSFVFQYYELLQASFAWLLGVHYLTFYHVLSPFVVGCLAFLSLYLLLGAFYSETRVKLVGAVFFVVVALLLGETHRTYGNLSIARAFHGKFVLLYLGFYSWVYFSLKYFEQRLVRQVFHLALVGVALTTLTTTTFVYIPLLSLTIYTAFFFSRGALLSADCLRVGVGYLVSLLPIVVLAFNFRREAQKVMPAGSAINSGFTSDFFGQVAYLVNRHIPVTPVLFLSSFLIVAFLSKHRKFITAWVLIPFVFILNPAVSSFVITYITTENAYWRMFYLLPFPLIAVLAFCDLVKRAPNFKAATTVFLVLFFGLILVSPSSVLRTENAAHLEFLSYKVHEPVRSFVRKFYETKAAGACLCPLEVASNLVIYTSNFPQYLVREDYLRFILKAHVGEDEALERSRAASYLYSGESDATARSGFHRFIEAKMPEYIVLRQNSSTTREAGQYLSSLGYSRDSLNGFEYEVWRK